MSWLYQRDRLLLLKSGGRTVYFGDIGKDSNVIRSYFAKHGAHCPENANPAECATAPAFCPALLLMRSSPHQTCSKPLVQDLAGWSGQYLFAAIALALKLTTFLLEQKEGLGRHLVRLGGARRSQGPDRRAQD